MRDIQPVSVVRMRLTCDVCSKAGEWTGPDYQVEKDAAAAGWRVLADPLGIGKFDDRFDVCSRPCADKRVFESLTRTYGNA